VSKQSKPPNFWCLAQQPRPASGLRSSRLGEWQADPVSEAAVGASNRHSLALDFYAAYTAGLQVSDIN
jgi:hypothetical protein